MALQAKLAEKPMIGRPEKLPIAALPEIPEYKVPRMSQYFQMQLPESDLPFVRRVGESDIGDLCVKSLPLFQARFPRLTLDAAMSFVRMHLNRNDARVVRTDKAWGSLSCNGLFSSRKLSSRLCGLRSWKLRPQTRWRFMLILRTGRKASGQLNCISTL